MKGLVRGAMERVAKRWGYEMRREPSAQSFLHARSVDLVIDVGANVGQLASGLRKGGYAGSIHSFEPVSSVYVALSAAAAGDPKWMTTRAAVGSAAGEVTIHVSAASVYSSIRAPTRFGEDRDAGMTAVATEVVPVVMLDEAVELAGSNKVFLKIDTQGFEREVLDGASRLITRCVGLQLELPIAHLYDGVWDFDEAIGHAKALGFVPAQFRTVCTSDAIPASAVEVDCIFRRAA